MQVYIRIYWMSQLLPSAAEFTWNYRLPHRSTYRTIIVFSIRIIVKLSFSDSDFRFFKNFWYSNSSDMIPINRPITINNHSISFISLMLQDVKANELEVARWLWAWNTTYCLQYSLSYIWIHIVATIDNL